jgi:hypothetical protein
VAAHSLKLRGDIGRGSISAMFVLVATPIISASRNQEQSDLKSAMSSRSRSAGAITDSCIRAGNETTWWQNLNVNALEIAKRLWEDSRKHPKAPALPGSLE